MSGSGLVLFVVIVSLGVVVGVVAGLRARRLQRSVPEFRRAKELTDGMSRRKKVEIGRSVRRGQAVRDPRDAEAAVAVARQMLRSSEIFGRGRLARVMDVVGVLLACGAVALWLATGDERRLLHLAYPLTFVGIGLVIRRLLMARAERAVEANERLLEHVAAPSADAGAHVSPDPGRGTMAP